MKSEFKNLFVGIGKIRKRIFLCLVVLLFAFAGVLIWFAWDYHVYYKKMHEHYENFLAHIKAMEVGDGETALYWAKTLPSLSVTRKDRFSGEWQTSGKWQIGNAYEMLEDYDKALEIYEALFIEGKFSGAGMNRLGTAAIKGRVLYKKKNDKESFIAYCSYVDAFLNDEVNKALIERNQGALNADLLGNFRELITLESDPVTMRLSPFLEFSDFCQFMEDEYDKLDDPRQYESEMAFISKVNQSQEELDDKIWGNMKSKKHNKEYKYRAWTRLKEERKALALKD